MAMGKRRRHAKQRSMWVATHDLPRSAAHPFYTRLNQILDTNDFDAHVDGLCQRSYADDGRPGLPPGHYFWLLLIGYFEGLDTERDIAWRAADSFALREFMWILQRLADAGLAKGQAVDIDATTLEANAALRSIVRRDPGESYHDFLTKLAQASGIETSTRADLSRIDRTRKKKGSNDEWTHPNDPDAKITKMKDDRTHLAHKAEHAVDLETGASVGVTVQEGDDGDTTPSIETLIDAAERVETVRPDGDSITGGVGDKGHYGNQSLVDLEAVGVRSYISEPDRGRRNWKKNAAARDAVYRNRRRIRGTRGQRLLRLRGECLERRFAHLYETGGIRRVHLRWHTNILKRLLIHNTDGFNLGLLMRQLIGVGTRRGLQGRMVAFIGALLTLLRTLWQRLASHWLSPRLSSALERPSIALCDLAHMGAMKNSFHHGLLATTFAVCCGCSGTGVVTEAQVRSTLEVDEPAYARAAELGPGALPHLARLVNAGSHLAAKAAYLASLIKDRRSVEILHAAARSKDPSVRVAAAAAASNLPEPSASQLILLLLEDPDEGVRATAVDAAGPGRSEDLQHRIANLAEADPSPTVKEKAAQVLRPPSR